MKSVLLKNTFNDVIDVYDKAGAYALQGEAAIYISGITGDYYTIVGLPVHLVYKHLQEMGY